VGKSTISWLTASEQGGRPMAKAVFTKLSIACEYLDMAMQLYIEERNYFCAIHLAGAAEELFGKHLPEHERIYTIVRNAQKALHEIETGQKPTKRELDAFVTYAKNAIKHEDYESGERSVTLDVVFEARRYIEDALINFNKLREIETLRPHLVKSPTKWKFEDYQNSKDDEEMQRLVRQHIINQQ
jgi:hypothetical protein